MSCFCFARLQEVAAARAAYLKIPDAPKPRKACQDAVHGGGLNLFPRVGPPEHACAASAAVPRAHIVSLGSTRCVFAPPRPSPYREYKSNTCVFVCLLSRRRARARGGAAAAGA